MRWRNLTNRLTGWPVIATWGLAIVAGMFGLARYQMTPGATPGATPAHWPASATFPRARDRFTLIMTLHPMCSCSRASLHELEEVVARADGRIDARLLFIRPEGAPADWLDSSLCREARNTRGVNFTVDENGANAAAFGATTSGQVMLYDASGVLRFSGGITDGRGHEGDNAGQQAILELLKNGNANVASTPVYGCSLGKCNLTPQLKD
jgi:hypothetical protein